MNVYRCNCIYGNCIYDDEDKSQVNRERADYRASFEHAYLEHIEYMVFVVVAWT